MAEIELKPCPFCGGKAELRKELIMFSPKTYAYRIACASINCTITAYTELRYRVEDAIEEWNRRVDDD